MRKIIGPDVSFYQDDPGTPQEINFERMNQAADYVIIRAGQNLWIDSDFRNNWRRAKEAGLPRGSYWFYDSRADPKQQAELWVNAMGGDFGELPLFLDLEEATVGPSPAGGTGKPVSSDSGPSWVRKRSASTQPIITGTATPRSTNRLNSNTFIVIRYGSRIMA